MLSNFHSILINITKNHPNSTGCKTVTFYIAMNQPLAERLRPKTLEDYLSQQHLIGKNGALKQQIKQGIIPSMIFWGPPGVGKTTLANIIATESGRPFFTLSAISSGVKDVREIIEKAKKSDGLFTTKSPILFIDEIHRFSKSQQDSLIRSGGKRLGNINRSNY